MKSTVTLFSFATAVQLLRAPFVNAIVFGQCGGMGWTGTDTCDPPTICEYENIWFSQCVVPRPIATTSTTTATLISTPSTPVVVARATITSPTSGLGQYMRTNGKYWGTYADKRSLSTIQPDPFTNAEFNQLTSLNSMKWDATEPSQGAFSFGASDLFVNYATANNKIIRGWPLLSYTQLPSWVSAITNQATLTTAIQRHVTMLVSRYKGKVAYWDVVNEPLNEDGSLRRSVFYNVLGQSYINIAFAAARAADPSAKLYITDYNLDSATSAKTIAMVALVKSLITAGVPIDGIGSEGHLTAGQASGTKAALTLLSSVVPQVAITQLDIVGAAPANYLAVCNACISLAACVGITTSVSDGNSWHTLLN